MARKPPSQPKSDYKNCAVLGPLIERYVNGKKRRYIRLRCKRCQKEREIVFTNKFPQDGPVCRGCSKPRLRHGMAGTRTHNAWEGMRNRVHHDEPYIVALGITIEDPDWDTFEGFLADMGEIPDDKISLDRIDNTRGYGKILMDDGTRKLNCRWADYVEQMNNTSNNVVIEIDKKPMTVAQAATHFKISYMALYKSVFERGENADEAVFRLVAAKDDGPSLSEIAAVAGVDYECLRRQVMRGRRMVADAILYLQNKLTAGTRAAAARALGVPIHVLRGRMDRGMTLQQAIEDVKSAASRPTLKEIARQAGIHYTTLLARMKRGESQEAAIQSLQDKKAKRQGAII